MRSRVPRKSVDFESIDLGDSLYSYPHGIRPDNLAPYKVLLSLACDQSMSLSSDNSGTCRSTSEMCRMEKLSKQ